MTRKNSSASTLQFSPNRPIADGIRFCEMSLLPPPVQKMLAARGLIWLTEFEHDMGGSVIAKDLEQAVVISDARGLGERVVGAMSGGDGMPYMPD